jgi:hypothetical protein
LLYSDRYYRKCNELNSKKKYFKTWFCSSFEDNPPKATAGSARKDPKVP